MYQPTKVGAYDLQELRSLDKSTAEEILASPEWLEDRIRSTSERNENAFEESILFLKVLSKLFNDHKYSGRPEVITCLSIVATEDYFSNLYRLLQEMLDSDNHTRVSVLETIVDFLQHVCNRLPSSSLYCFGLCCHLTSVSFPADVDADLQQRLSDVKEKANMVKLSISDLVVKPKVKTIASSQQRSRKPPNDFRKIQILPTNDDIMSVPFLRKILKKGAFDDLEHYLDVHFRLLREDCINQLRSGISEYIKSKQIDQKKDVRKLQDGKLYKNVKITKKTASIDGPIYTLRLDKNHVERIRWEKSNRLLYGSLLCLSPDDFQKRYFAIITESDHEVIRKQCTIQVNVQREKGFSEVPIGTQLVMVESSAYFEAHRHVLKCLQNLNETDLPFSKYIIDCTTEVDIPKYLRRNDTVEYDLLPVIENSQIYASKTNTRGRKKSNVRILGDYFWPSAEELHLDESQYNAFKSALTKEFVIIQGPPGTGKTFIGLQIVKTLLHNESKWQNGNNFTFWNGNYQIKRTHPMLVVCFTNHALDQFMEGIINFMDESNKRDWEPHVVRVGGRCTNTNVEKMSLKYKRRFFRSKRVDHKQYVDQLIAIRREINRIKWNISMAERNILNENVLRENVPEMQVFIRDKLVKQKYKDVSSSLIEWLNIDCYVKKRASTKYVTYKTQFKNCNVTSPCNQQEEKIFIETESEQVKHERQIEEDDFQTDYQFEEIGISFNTILENLLKNQECINKKFDTLLRTELANVKRMFSDILPMSKTEAKQNLPNVWNMEVRERWRLYRYFVNTYCEKQTKTLNELKERYDGLYCEYNIEKQRADKKILCDAKVIAMTTSAAARYQEVLNEVQPKIIIVEEAAEVLEAHIISTLNSKCEHLILIGDHKQLEPKPSVYDLGEKYNLSLSMFERMIENKLPFDCLQCQHRMRPKISQLVRNIYPTLKDYKTVKNYKNILGVEKDVFFISHSNAESHTEENRSYSNAFEAMYIKRLTKYLLQQGYSPSQITVLTPYSGQMFCIRYLMSRREFDGIRISILDNYQGEECDIILLSLVRSNTERTIGFLCKENRVCVALSRAKEGLYVIGDFEMIRVARRKCTIWEDAINQMEEAKSIGKGLPLQCQNHPDHRITAARPDDFDKVPEGGCLKSCGFIRSCDHVCTLNCHTYDNKHLSIKCKSKCLKVCEREHGCKRQCHFPTPCFCKTKVKKELPCSHEADIPCYVLPQDFECVEMVRRLLTCGHHVDLKCHEDYRSYKCTLKVSKTLPKCTHEVEMFCHESPDTFPCSTLVSTDFECRHQNVNVPCFKVDDTLCKSECQKSCKMGHYCREICHYPTACICNETVTKRLPNCSHTKQLKCHEDPASITCEEFVKVKLSKCGHETFIKCNEDPNQVQCIVEEFKTLVCGHKVKVKCSTLPTTVKCPELVIKKLPCNHVIKDECHKNILEITCPELVIKRLPECDHSVSAECHLDPKNIKCEETVKYNMPFCQHSNSMPCKIYQNFVSKIPNQQNLPDCKVLFQLLICKENCGSTLLCGHQCSAACNACMRGPLHKVCSNKCDRLLLCGHKCKRSTCGKCVQCNEKCTSTCSHGSCQYVCHRPCLNCTEPCDWRCVHFSCEKRCHEVCDRPRCNAKCYKKLECGHFCMGLCGDPCPDLCGLCNPMELKKIGITESEIPKTRLVVLQECKHVFPMAEIDRFMDSDTNALAPKRCPRCQKYIDSHPRYTSLLKKHAKYANTMKTIILTISQNLKFNFFPTFSANKENCLNYLQDIGTFLFAEEEKIIIIDKEIFEITKERIQIVKKWLNNEKRIDSQTIFDIFNIFAILSASWKLIVVMLRADSLLYELSSDEKGELFLWPVVALQEVIHPLRENILKVEAHRESRLRDDVRNLEWFEHLLSREDRAWIREANRYPKITYYVDVHQDAWTLCREGHPYCSFNDEQQCLTCTGVDNFMPQFHQQTEYVGKAGKKESRRVRQKTDLKNVTNSQESRNKNKYEMRFTQCPNRVQNVYRREGSHSRRSYPVTDDQLPCGNPDYSDTAKPTKSPHTRRNTSRGSRNRGGYQNVNFLDERQSSTLRGDESRVCNVHPGRKKHRGKRKD